MIERISKSDYNLIITGRSVAANFTGKNVTFSATNTARSTILIDIITKYFSADLTTNNLETDTGIATVNYFDKPFFEVVEEICNAAGFDAYIDKDSDFNYFLSGSRKNNTEAVVHESNLIGTGDFSSDASNIFNKIKVYGNEIDGVPLIATAQDTSSQNTFKVKELKIDDSSITTSTQAQARADFELSLNKDPPTIGEVVSLGLPTILPGEMVRISDPFNGLEPKYYIIQKFTHKFSNDEPIKTALTVQKERSTIPRILRKRIKFESEITSVNNPNEMDYSFLEDFDVDTGIHSSTEISGGSLKVSKGLSAGTWTSSNISLSGDIQGKTIELRLKGSGFINSRISYDGGITFSNLSFSTLTNVPSGNSINSIQIELNLLTASSQANIIGILYTIN